MKTLLVKDEISKNTAREWFLEKVSGLTIIKIRIVLKMSFEGK